MISGFMASPQKTDHIYIENPALDMSIISSVIDSSVRSVLTVGAYIIIFSVISEIFGILHIYDGLAVLLSPLGLDDSLSKAAAIGIFEVTNGCRSAAAPTPNALLTATVLCGFGGFSIHAQSTAFFKDTDLSCIPYLAGKVITAALCLIYGALLLKLSV